MTLAAPVAVTGARGRLGRAILWALRDRGLEALAWSRPDYDLDDPGAAERVVAAGGPRTVIHAAAWTDVDGCARRPEVAMRRNATAVDELAAACAARGIAFVLVSTNEVFDGEPREKRGYRETDRPRPINPYGASKLAGESAAERAYRQAGGISRLTIVRTAWLFGPPGNDFPAKIVAASDATAAGEPLRVVDDEVGPPTYSRDLAVGLLDLLAHGTGGVYHLVNAGRASRLEVARAVLRRCRPGSRLVGIGRDAFPRASQPPAWAVLDGSRAHELGIRLRDWREALDDYLSELCEDPRSAATASANDGFATSRSERIG